MEEVLTIDGKQFKLTTDRPLTAEQKAQTITEIRKQTGCGTCGPKVASANPNWKYGGIKSLAVTCPAPGISGAEDNPKVVTNTITMVATPVQGVSPYMITFRKTPAASADGSEAGATEVMTAGRLGGLANPTTKTITEGTPITRVYTLDLDDLNGAVTKAGDTMPSITFASTIEDSCTPVQTCVNACKIFVGCVPPVCDFVVS
jgi:hypothetical protein